MPRKHYASDLTDSQWALLEPLIPAAKHGGRPRTANPREVLCAIFYVLKTGCQWSYLPEGFPPRSTVHEYFKRWQDDGTLGAINKTLRCDAGYRGEEVSTKAYVEGQWAVRIVTRRDDQVGFEVQPIRWIVERTFAWLMKCRRLTADVEKTVSSATGMIYLAMISLMLRRLEPAS